MKEIGYGMNYLTAVFLALWAGEIFAGEVSSSIPPPLMEEIRGTVWVQSSYSKLVAQFRKEKNPSVRQRMVEELGTLLTAKEVPAEGKNSLLRAFFVIGFPKDLSGVKACLADSRTAESALSVLIAASPVQEVEALWKQVGEKGRCAILNGLAMRGDGTFIARHLKDPSEIVAENAYLALGRIGDAAALAQLMANEPGGKLQNAWSVAVGGAFEHLILAGQLQTALPAARKLFAQSTRSPMLRSAAARVMVTADSRAFAAVMKDPCPKVRQSIIRGVGQIDAKVLAAALEGACDRDRIAILGRFAENRDRGGLQAALTCLESKSEDVVCAALDTLCVIGSGDQVDAIVPLLSRKGRIASAASFTLSNMRDESVGSVLFKRAESVPALIPILGERAQTALVKGWTPLLASSSASVRKSAWKAISRDASPEIAPALMGWLELVKPAETTLARSVYLASLRGMDEAGRIKVIQDAWRKNTASASRMVLVGIMDNFKAGSFLPLLLPVLKESGSSALREEVATVLAGWNSLDLLKPLAEAYSAEKEGSVKRSLARASLKVIESAGKNGRDRLYSDLFKRIDSGDSRYVSLLIFNDLKEGTYPLLAALADDPRCGTFARKCYLDLYDKHFKADAKGVEKLNGGGWSLDASCSPDSLGALRDGNPKTRWTSGCPSAPGMWVSVDLGVRHEIDRVDLNVPFSPKDTPNGCRVLISDDGKEWSQPVARAGGESRGSTPIKIGRTARYLKFVTEKGRPKNYWSIGELQIWGRIDPELLSEIKRNAELFRK